MEGKLSNAQIIDPKLLDADGRCVFGATVEPRGLDTGDTVTYQIVGDDEADIKEGKIAIASPDCAGADWQVCRRCGRGSGAEGRAVLN